MLMGSNGGNPRVLTPAGRQEILSDWSGDGQSLLFGYAGPEGWQIYQRELANAQEQMLTREGGITARVSTDGQFLFHVRPGKPGLWRLNLTESQPAELVIAELANGDRGNWLVRGDKIYWVLRSGGNSILTEYDLNTGQSAFITDLPGFAGSGLCLAPDGDSFIFARTGNIAGDLLLIPLAPF